MHSFLTVAYLAAGVLFILSLAGLSHQDTARRGNVFGMVGMAIAIVATMLHDRIAAYPLMFGAIVVGAAIGTPMASRVAMTAMPEMVAILHSFVGLAAVLVGISTFLDPTVHHTGAEQVVHQIEIWLGVAIGGITFTGSVIAWGKLRGTIGGRPLLLPGRHGLNALATFAVLAMGVPFVSGTDPATALWLLLAMTFVSFLLGVHLVMAIGGADMPVVVSLLNSYSGWAAAAAGFMLANDLLIITGALVGSSGAILSYIMCRAMNRSIWNVVFGGFGTEATLVPVGGGADRGEVHTIDVGGLVAMLRQARKVVIVPGYGMAVARAQNPVEELTRLLRDRRVDVRFAIHPVAGRLPGHMNVLLAEAGVPYDIVEEMDAINGDLGEVDVVLVIGANDIVNPGALEDPSSPIWGMPVLEVWRSGTVVVSKRGMSTGYAGVENPLFFKANTRMLFGDARGTIEELVAALRAA